MQDQVGAHSTDRTALPDYRPCRELASHPQYHRPYLQVGNQEMGRDSSRLRKEGIRVAKVPIREAHNNTVALTRFYQILSQ